MPVELYLKILHAGDDKLRHRRGCFHTRVGHHVGDGLIAFMTDACDDGQRKLRNMAAQFIGVETVQVERGPSAPDDDEQVKNVHFFIDTVHGVDDRGLCLVTLHNGGKQPHRKAIALLVVAQLIHKIAESRGSFAADDGDMLGHERQGLLFVHFKNAVGHQLVDDLLPSSGPFAKGVLRVNVANVERKAVNFMKLHRGIEKYLHPRFQALACQALKPPAQVAVGVRPYRGPHLGFYLIAVLFHHLHVAMPRTVDAHLAYLGHHPVRGLEPFFQDFPDQLVQFVQREVLHGFRVIFCRMAGPLRYRHLADDHKIDFFSWIFDHFGA